MYRQSSLQCQLRTYACDALGVTAVWLLLVTIYQSGVEDTRLEAKDTKKIRGQGQPFRGQTSRGQGKGCLRPRTKDTAASVLKKKKVFKKVF